MLRAPSALLVLATGTCALGALALACRVPRAQEVIDPVEVDEVLASFRDSCTGCHVPPDVRFAAERAWLARLDATG